MNQTRRIFIALNLPEVIKQHCLFVQKMIKELIADQAIDAPRVIFISPENFHITLKAPMHIDDKAIELLTQALSCIEFNQFELCTSDVFYLKRNQLVWLNVIGQYLEELVSLIHECVREANLGIAIEENILPLRGHITLVRRLSLKDPEVMLETIKDKISPTCFTAKEFVVKETLRESGRVIGYKDIAHFALK